MKIEITKKENIFADKVEIREVTVGDYLQAERESGKSDGFAFQVSLLSAIATFDGQKRDIEEVQKMPTADFLDLQQALVENNLLVSEELSSTLQQKEK